MQYTISGGPFPNCADKNTRTITIISKDQAKISLGQGPFCLSDGIQNLELDANASAGIWSGTGIIDANVGKFDPVIAGAGMHLITYKTNGICFVQDTLTIVVVAQKYANIITPDTAVCNNAVPFKIRTSNNTTAGGIWISIPTGLVNAGGIFDASKGFPGGPYQIYYLIQGATLACSAADSVLISINKTDTANITPDQGPFCIADPAKILSLDANAHAGSWKGNGTSISGLFDPAAAGAGTILVSYITNGACPVIDTVHIFVNAKKIANIITSDTSVCKKSPAFQIKLSSNSSAGGMWLENLFPTTSTFNPSISTAATHKIYYAIQGFNLACSAVDSVLVTVILNADASITTPIKLDFCSSDKEISLSPAIVPATGAWWGVPSAGVDNMGKYDPSKAREGKTKVYYGISGKCGDTAFVELTTKPIPVFDLGEDLILCEGEQTTIGTGVTADSYLWSPGGLQEQAISVVINGTYTLSLTNNPNCIYRDTVEITFLPKPLIDIGNDTVLCLEDMGGKYSIKGNNAKFQYLWNTGDTSMFIQITKAGTYTVTANFPGSQCKVSDGISINDYCVPSIYFPNVFTPNGDGINETFPTPAIHLKGYHIMIFNRWGELLFESTNESKAWDGIYQGRIVQEDVYVWKVDYEIEEETGELTGKTQIGKVTVLR